MAADPSRADIPSIAERARPIAAGAPISGVHFLGRTAVFVLGEEAQLFVDHAQARRVPVHAGAILAAASDGARVGTGGDDGEGVATGEGGREGQRGGEASGA